MIGRQLNKSCFLNNKFYRNSFLLTQQQLQAARSIRREPSQPIPNRKPKFVTAEEAVSIIKSKDTVFVHGGSATPTHLVSAMSKYGLEEKLSDVRLIHIHTVGPMPVEDKYKGIFKDISLFIGKNVRGAVSNGNADCIPIFLSEIPQLFHNYINLNVALVQVSEPGNHDFCSLGTSVDCTLDAVRTANIVIGQINKYMPRTFGDGQIHMSHFDYLVRHDELLPGQNNTPISPSPAQKKIGKTVASIIEDGSTLQMGIGAIPDAVLHSLTNHRDIGIHTEMFEDGIVGLVEKGVITNSKKTKHPGKIVGSFMTGSKKTYSFVDDNPSVQMASCRYVNDPAVIRENPRVCAINSAIEVDLTGQISADSIGTRMFSGVGGQMDFMRGAALSENGKPMIAIPSITKDGKSRIVSTLNIGAGVTTTRAHVHYIVTEHGYVYLHGKTLRERAKLLIGIAHPDHRERLEREFFERFGAADN